MTRFDDPDETFSRENWYVGDDGDNTFFLHIEKTIRLLEQSSRLRVRTQNTEGEDIDASWNVERL